MGKDKEVQCVHYIAEKNCEIGGEGTFRSKCQKCKNYEKLKGGRLAKKNSKRQKQQKKS